MVLVKAGRALIRPSPGSPPSAFRDCTPGLPLLPELRRSPAPPPGGGAFHFVPASRHVCLCMVPACPHATPR